MELEDITNDPYILGKCKEVSYISHLGSRSNTGQFLATIRKKHKWFRISDCQVKKVTNKMCFGKIESSEAILVEYRLE